MRSINCSFDFQNNNFSLINSENFGLEHWSVINMIGSMIKQFNINNAKSEATECCYGCNCCGRPWKRRNRNETGQTRANTQTIRSIRWSSALFDFRMEIYRSSVVKAQYSSKAAIAIQRMNCMHACIGASINVFDYFYFTIFFSFSLFQ